MKENELSAQELEFLKQKRLQKAQAQASQTQQEQEKIEKKKVEKTKEVKASKKIAVSPYVDASENYRSILQKLNFSRTFFFAGFLVNTIATLVLVGAYINFAASPPYRPYVFAVDSHGVAVGMGPANAVPTADEKVKMAMITDFIRNARSVTLDLAVLRRNVFKVFACLRQNDPAYIKMTEYYTSAESPDKRAATVLVDMRIMSVIPQTPTTFEVTWVETTRDRKGAKVAPDLPMRALVTFTQDQPSTDLEKLLDNPFGIYITDFSWGQVKG